MDRPAGIRWSCHVCGASRPEDVIATHVRVLPSAFDGSVEWRVSARYCADREACSRGVAAVVEAMLQHATRAT